MKMEVHGLSLSLGYRDDWHGAVPNPTPERMRLLKEAARVAMRREYGWLVGPPCDLKAFELVVANLEAAFNTGTGRLDSETLQAAVLQLIKCKQPSVVQGDFALAVDTGDLYGTCIPPADPPPFVWMDRHSYNLISPSGKRASVTVSADDTEIKVKLVVSVSWGVPELAVH